MPRVVSPEDKRLRANRLASQVARSSQPFESNEVFKLDAGEKTELSAMGLEVAATINRTGYGLYPLFKLTPSGSVKIHVAIQSVPEILKQDHYSTRCFDCGDEDCTGEINGCPGRTKRLYRVCPVISCRKRVYDPQPTGMRLTDDFDRTDRASEDEEFAIKDEAYSKSTPESRTKTEMDFHIAGYHPSEAASYGINVVNRMAVA